MEYCRVPVTPLDLLHLLLDTRIRLWEFHLLFFGGVKADLNFIVATADHNCHPWATILGRSE
jgi:hypothetical protein